MRNPIAKMKVHPGIFMKTKEGEFQVSGAGCQGQGSLWGAEPNPELSASIAVIMGILHETGRSNSSKMKVHPGMFMKTKEGEFRVSNARCQGQGPRWVAEPNTELSTSIAVIVDILRETVTEQFIENEGPSGDIHENKGTSNS